MADHQIRELSRGDVEALGFFLEGLPVTAEIGDVVAGQVIGRERPNEVIVAINTGMAVEDVTTARHVYDLAVARSRGIWLPL